MKKFLPLIIGTIVIGSVVFLYKTNKENQVAEQKAKDMMETRLQEQDLELKFSKLKPSTSIQSFTDILGTPDVIDHPVFENVKEYRYIVDDKYVVLPETNKDGIVIGFEALAREGFHPHFKENSVFDFTLNETSFQDVVSGKIKPEKCYLVEKNMQALLYFQQYNLGEESFSIGLQTFKYFENNLPNYRVSVGDLPFGEISCKKINPKYNKLVPNTIVFWNNNLLKASTK